MKAIICAAICATLAGCCTKPPVVVPVSCVKSTPERSPSLFDKTSAEADIAEQVRALLIDRDVTEIYVGGLEAIVAGCR